MDLHCTPKHAPKKESVEKNPIPTTAQLLAIALGMKLNWNKKKSWALKKDSVFLCVTQIVHMYMSNQKKKKTNKRKTFGYLLLWAENVKSFNEITFQFGEKTIYQM